MDSYVPPKLPKSDSRVSLRPAWDGEPDTSRPHCGGCRFYQWGSCSLVEGSIAATEVCDLFHEPVQTYVPDSAYAYAELASVAARDGGAALFVQTAAFAEAVDGEIVPPEWMPLLPLPGTYRHPHYGDIDISRERNSRFVDNFANRVYDQEIPVDAEHELKLSGAVGYITALRQNTDGSVDGKVRWTERGEKLIGGGGYRYVSPEWFGTWDQPETGTTYNDVLIGAAITTRPFFKESALRGLLTSLVASESGIRHEEATVVDSAGNAETIVETDLQRVEAPADSTPTPTEATTDAGTTDAGAERTPTDTAAGATTNDAAASGADGMTDNQTPQPGANDNATPTSVQFGELQGRVQAAEAKAEQFKEANEQLSGRLAAMEKADRTRRFGETVKDWPGDREKNVSTLVRFAESFGEDSDEFKGFVDGQKETARAFNEAIADRSKPRGSSAGISDSPAAQKFREHVDQVKASESNLTPAQVDAKALEALAVADPDAYEAITGR